MIPANSRSWDVKAARRRYWYFLCFGRHELTMFIVIQPFSAFIHHILLTACPVTFLLSICWSGILLPRAHTRISLFLDSLFFCYIMLGSSCTHSLHTTLPEIIPSSAQIISIILVFVCLLPWGYALVPASS